MAINKFFEGLQGKAFKVKCMLSENCDDREIFLRQDKTKCDFFNSFN